MNIRILTCMSLCFLIQYVSAMDRVCLERYKKELQALHAMVTDTHKTSDERLDAAKRAYEIVNAIQRAQLNEVNEIGKRFKTQFPNAQEQMRINALLGASIDFSQPKAKIELAIMMAAGKKRAENVGPTQRLIDLFMKESKKLCASGWAELDECSAEFDRAMRGLW